MTWTPDGNSIATYSPTPTGDAAQNINANFSQISSLISAANTVIAELQAAIAVTAVTQANGLTLTAGTLALSDIPESAVTNLTSNLSAKAPIASPTFTTNATAPQFVATTESLTIPGYTFSGATNWGLGYFSDNLLFFADGVLACAISGEPIYQYRIPSSWSYSWASSTNNETDADTAISRLSAGVIACGNGTFGDYSGTVQLSNLTFADSTTQSSAALPLHGGSMNGVTNFNGHNVNLSNGGGAGGATFNMDAGSLYLNAYGTTSAYVSTDNDGGITFVDAGGNILQWNQWDDNGLTIGGNIWINGEFNVYLNGSTMTGLSEVVFSDSSTQSTAYQGPPGIGTVLAQSVDCASYGLDNLGTISQITDASIGFFGASPVSQQTGTGSTATGEPGGTGTQVYSDTEFQGNGGTEYTINDIIIALKAYGLLAL